MENTRQCTIKLVRTGEAHRREEKVTSIWICRGRKPWKRGPAQASGVEREKVSAGVIIRRYEK